MECPVGGHDREIFGESLRDEHAVERIGVVERQIEKRKSVLRGVGQYSEPQVGETLENFRFSKSELATSLLNRDLQEGDDA